MRSACPGPPPPQDAVAAPHRPPPSPTFPLVPAPPRRQETARSNQIAPLFFLSSGRGQSPRPELHPDPASTNHLRGDGDFTSISTNRLALRRSANQKSPWPYLRRRLANALCRSPCDQWGCCPRRPIRAGQSPRGVTRGPMGVQAGQILLNSLLLGSSLVIRCESGLEGVERGRAQPPPPLAGLSSSRRGPRRWGSAAGPGSAGLPTSFRVSR